MSGPIDKIDGWRRDAEIYLIGVDEEKCEACGQCVDICSEQVFEMKAGVAEPVSSEKCLGCRGCEEVCPNDAISVVQI